MDNGKVVQGDESVWKIVPGWIKLVVGLVIFIAVVITFANTTKKPDKNCSVKIRFEKNEEKNMINLYAQNGEKYICAVMDGGADCELPK